MFELLNIRLDDRRMQGRVEAFLGDHPDPGVRLRPEDQLRLALDSGQGLVLLRDDGIVGVSLVYQFDVPPDGPVYFEIGTMRVVANGHGLQAFLTAFHLHQIRLEEDTADIPPVFAVVSPGTASEHNLQVKAGLTPWSPPGGLAALRAAAGVPFNDAKRVLAAPPSAFEAALAALRSWHVGANRFRTPKDTAPVHVGLGWFNETTLTAA